MWLSRQKINQREECALQTGTVTMGSGKTAVYTDRERRGISIFAPGGYVWRPTVGQELLILKTEDGGLCASGAEVLPAPEGFADGEVYITSKGGASVWLKNDGSLYLTGAVRIDGSLYVNGTKID